MGSFRKVRYAMPLVAIGLITTAAVADRSSIRIKTSQQPDAPRTSQQVVAASINFLDRITMIHVGGLLQQHGIDSLFGTHSGTGDFLVSASDLKRAQTLIRRDMRVRGYAIRLSGGRIPTPAHAGPGWRTIPLRPPWERTDSAKALSPVLKQLMDRIAGTEPCQRYPYTRALRYRLRTYLEPISARHVKLQSAYEVDAVLAISPDSDAKSAQYLFQIMPEARDDIYIPLVESH